MRNLALISLAVLFQFGAWIPSVAHGHGGRRFEVKVVDNQLFAQGYISTGGDDGGGNPRTYHNSLHDHWDNFPGGVDAALAVLPGFDVFDSENSYINANGYSGGGVSELLQGGNLLLTLVGATKWKSPPGAQPFGTPNLEPLTSNDLISIYNGTGPVDTQNLGTLTLVQNISQWGEIDLDLEYTIENKPSDVIYALEWVLSTTAGGIADSDSIYTIISPDPDPKNTGLPNTMLGLHHQSLYLEQYLGTPIETPEPTSLVLVGWGSTCLMLMMGRRRRRLAASA